MLSGLTEFIRSPAFLGLIAKLIVLFVCFPVHECAHAWTAAKLGDRTGEAAGRVTLNPLVHLDLWGTVMLLAFGAGYAKPVPVNRYNLNKPKRDSAIIALAGPLSNLAMALALMLAGYAVRAVSSKITGDWTPAYYLTYILRYAAYINMTLAVLNMIPVPPFDGYKVVSAIAPARFSYRISGLERNPLYAVLGLLLIFNVLGFSPVAAAANRLFAAVDGLCGNLFL